MSEEVKVIRGRTMLGLLREIELVDEGSFDAPGSRLEHHLVTAKNQTYIYKFVSRAAGAGDPGLYDLLDNEVRAGARLGQIYATRYPGELASLVAYNVDAEEPFALLRAYHGTPAAGRTNQLDSGARRQFEVGLLGALHLTGAAGVVHGALTIDAVRWDGRKVQLVNFENAERVGDRRRAGLTSAGRSPEQNAGSGVVDARDDMWAAGLLIRELELGSLTNGFGQDRRDDPERLRALLGPVFDRTVEHRASPADLLREMRADVPQPTMSDPDAVLDAGHRQFEQVSIRKRSAEAFSAGRRVAGRRSLRGRFAALFVVVVIVAVGMVVML